MFNRIYYLLKKYWDGDHKTLKTFDEFSENGVI